jgi:hypothetical protein
MNICTSALDNCYATTDSYGEICVGCNCCGRFGKGLKMYKARLSYHMICLDDNENFSQWADGYPEMIKLQEKNIKINIKYHERRVKYYANIVNKLKP